MPKLRPTGKRYWVSLSTGFSIPVFTDGEMEYLPHLESGRGFVPHDNLRRSLMFNDPSPEDSLAILERYSRQEEK